MPIFKHQSKLDILLDTEIDLSGSRRLAILFTKPSGIKGEWLAQQGGTTYIKYEVVDSTVLDEVGRWQLQTMVIDSNGKIAFGEVTHINVSPTLLDGS